MAVQWSPVMASTCTRTSGRRSSKAGTASFSVSPRGPSSQSVARRTVTGPLAGVAAGDEPGPGAQAARSAAGAAPAPAPTTHRRDRPFGPAMTYLPRASGCRCGRRPAAARYGAPTQPSTPVSDRLPLGPGPPSRPAVRGTSRHVLLLLDDHSAALELVGAR